MAQAFDRKVFIAKVSFSDIGFLDTFILQFNAGADPHSLPALLYAQHDAETDRRPEPEMWRRLVDAYGARTADYVLMVIRIFFFANLLGNILDAVLVLCRGQDVAGQSRCFEAVFFLRTFWFMLPAKWLMSRENRSRAACSRAESPAGDIRPCHSPAFAPYFPGTEGTRRVKDQNPPVIEIRDLHKAYGELEVLKGVDLVAPRGHVVALIGSSGSGKSTLLRCANLLEESQQGEIYFEGEPIKWRGEGPARHPADRAQVTRIRTNLSMVFQQFNLWAHMTILENVMEAPVTVLKRDRDQVREAALGYLAKVGIGDKADVYPAQLSGGQQQRAAIARALCMEPRALLFDEPTSALDPELEQEVIRVIKDLATEGRTMVIVTHDMHLAADVADHVIFLHQGRIEEEGSPDRLFGAPETERLKGFLSHGAPA